MSQEVTIDALNDLIETAKDGEYGFRTSAEHLKSAQLQQLFVARAEECRQAASELQAMVTRLGGSAEDGGSASGALHRGWVSVKAKLSSYTDLAILEETVRGEDMALESYGDALAEDLSPTARTLVTQHFEGVKRNLAQMRLLLDQAQAASV